MLSRTFSEDELHLITNKKISQKCEDTIENIADDFPAGSETISQFPINLDYILTNKEMVLITFLSMHKMILASP